MVHFFLRSFPIMPTPLCIRIDRIAFPRKKMIGALLPHDPDRRVLPQNLITFAGSVKEEMVATASFSQRTWVLSSLAL